ncbi:MAG: putative sulfate exporter family transporter [Bryobacterales bacterium]|nr:putative sulfate exporter family transporter [Bryobacterales bacterium]
MPTSENPQTPTPLRKPAAVPWYSTEDWTSVWIGALVLVVILLGYRPELPSLKWADAAGLGSVFAPGKVIAWASIGFVMLVLALVGAMIQRIPLFPFALAFPFVFALALVAQALAGSALASTWGVEYVIFSLLLGLGISNTVGTPAWLKPAVRTEYFIKTGLVMMGATILFGEIVQAGALGIVQSILVVLVVWYVAYWLCKRFRLDDEFSAMLASAVAICGVSAAIAACGAIQGDKKKLSYVTSIVLIVAAPMIVIQPWMAKSLSMPDAVAGAWLGGTLDTTGSVVAAGALISETAMKVGTIVKFSQNVLLGVAAFLLSLWWTVRDKKGTGERPTARIIWERFPKFVLGFTVASLVFSFLLSDGIIADTKKVVGGLRTMWFALAFVCIGLETRFKEILEMEQGRPAFAFLGAQGFNLIWTYLLAWLVFGGLIVASPF